MHACAVDIPLNFGNGQGANGAVGGGLAAFYFVSAALMF